MSSRIHLNRNRQNLGQFSPEEVAEGLQSGRFLPADLAWREGMETWQPLSAFTDLPPPPEPVQPPAAGIPPAVPAGTEASAGAPMPSWERWEEIGMFRAAVMTIREVITSPITTFRDMRRGESLMRPFLFSYAMVVVCGLVGLLGEIACARFLPAGWMGNEENPFATVMAQLPMTLFILVVLGAAMPFFSAGIYYIAARLVAKADVDFETIFRAECYVSGALAILGMIPTPPIPLFAIIVLLFAFVLNTVYLIVAFREALRVPLPTSVAIVAAPILLGCVCGFGAAVLFVVGEQIVGRIPH